MRELNRKEGEMVSGGKKIAQIIVIGYPLPSFNTKLTGQAAANFLNSLGSVGYSGTGIGEQGGGGGGSPFVGKTTTGTHKVDSRCFTSKNGSNNPCDIMSGKFAMRHGATGVETNGTVIFATEQQGRYALGSLLDGNYGNDSVSTFAHNFTPPNPNYLNQTSHETINVESYMTSHGYTDFTGSINSMSYSEFNTFLDAITKAEGVTNMKGC